MNLVGRYWVLSIIVCFFIVLPDILAGKDQNPLHIGEFDDFLKERANKAVIEAMKSYEPDPEEVTKTFTIEVSEWVSVDTINDPKHDGSSIEMGYPSNFPA
ncbi:hypothetical protein LXL04_020999 [Taraxacum kok-saghyz]